ncbi:hypothetical protein F4804DRAFT_203166 [Jackrogersella minutella]|nr:hypothetical protein F4804DRAFT_203166 [Jackrogersella minutella]
MRKSVMMEALRWLKENHHLYFNMPLNNEFWNAWDNEDEVLLPEIIPNLTYPTDGEKEAAERSTYVPRQNNQPPTYDTEPVHHLDNNDKSIHDIDIPDEPLNGEETKNKLSEETDTDMLSSDTDSDIIMQDVPSPNQPSEEGTLDAEQDIETPTETMSDITESDITTKSSYVEEELLDDSDIDEKDRLEVLENLDEESTRQDAQHNLETDLGSPTDGILEQEKQLEKFSMSTSSAFFTFHKDQANDAQNALFIQQSLQTELHKDQPSRLLHNIHKSLVLVNSYLLPPHLSRTVPKRLYRHPTLVTRQMV